MLAIAAPWLVEFNWRSVLAWADDAFGFGLPQSWITPPEPKEREPRPKNEARRALSDKSGWWRERRVREKQSGDTPSCGIGERFEGASSRIPADEPTLGLPTGNKSGRYQRLTDCLEAAIG